MYLWKLIRKRLLWEENNEQKTEERDIKDLNNIKFWVEQLNNGRCYLLFIYNDKTYHINIEHNDIRVTTSTDCEDEIIDNIVSEFISPWDYHWYLAKNDFTMSPYSLADNLINWLFYYTDSEIKEILDKINCHRFKYLEYTKEEKIRKGKEKEEKKRWWEHKQYIF